MGTRIFSVSFSLPPFLPFSLPPLSLERAFRMFFTKTTQIFAREIAQSFQFERDALETF